MADDNPEDVSDLIRYRSKAVDDPTWIPQFLADRETGVLGLVDENSPHLVPQLFVYDPDANGIFTHGARDGRLHEIVTTGDRPRASFTTYEKGQYVPAAKPEDFTVEYSSVVASGLVDVLDEREEKRRILEQFMRKYAPHLTAGEDYERMAEAAIDRTAIYHLDVESWSGKRGWEEGDRSDLYDLNDGQ